MAKLTIVAVDDSALFRVLLSNAVRSIPDCEIIGTASDGQSAVQKIVELQPDLVTLDMEMPELDGMGVLQELKLRKVTSKVVIVSRLTTAGARITTDALLQGAFDFILKPSGKDPAANKAELTDALAQKISAIRENALSRRDTAPLVPFDQRKLKPADGSSFDAVVIGCSTGGPDALGRIVPFLEPDFPVPVIIVQHMPEGFTASLAKRLNEASEIPVVEAADGTVLQKGMAIVARGGHHVRLEKKPFRPVVVRLTDDPHEHSCRPAVDYTLRSAIEAFDGRIVSVILTGMGRDGTDGCRLVRERGGEVLAQDSESCVVFGMPKSVIQAGLADRIIPLSQMATTINAMFRR
ncbi:chemotaxis-specific protein-glutamate methyltransferase CheB [Schlesneria sp. T3-172]|uniref:chemotaxis-specific protein-glutamate methyltransferase CheB n=1 Tax=Schlesneria sphaerica TaxID=3373610 RepID=UPI0037CC3F3B